MTESPRTRSPGTRSPGTRSPGTRLPRTRWALSQQSDATSYADTFARLVAEGADVDGEARLADALLPRGGAVLDVGSGMGRVGAALVARGHRVTAIEPDPELADQSRRTFPDLAVLACDVLAFDPRDRGEHDAPEAYDLIIAVGNVLVYLAEDTERQVLARLRDLLAPGGRILVGYHLEQPRPGARRYPADEFTTDVEDAGLQVTARFGSYELHPPNDEYAVWLLSAGKVV